jgi:hypothetical protein
METFHVAAERQLPYRIFRHVPGGIHLIRLADGNHVQGLKVVLVEFDEFA